MAKPHLRLHELVRQGVAAKRRMAGHPSRLRPFAMTGDNPAGLEFHAYAPPQLPPGAALVVVLHGCRQQARLYDDGTGWTLLAAHEGFAVLAPEQTRANNPYGCFNWFDPAQVTRGRGEVASIAAATRAMIAAHDLDPGRVFVTGLSAGGAMASALLATYPDVFAGGAILAGLPYGVAGDAQSAFAAMREPRAVTSRALGDLVRAASPHRGPWPRVSVWHGLADDTVAAANGADCVRQWLDVHGLSDAARIEPDMDGARHRSWRDAKGRILVESYAIPGLAHGAPVGPSAPEARRGGVPGPFILDAGIHSTWHIAHRWELLDPTRAPAPPPPRIEEDDRVLPDPSAWARMTPAEVIERALRSAGVVR
ncbi:MAG: PHB depolymerase family esterase [Acetobacteraceae bacterium]|nr:PHB depolymerase family esterase [Acetobacteraceae bacterium]